MKTFVVADYHFGHSNIIKYCNRPFDNVEEMNEKLIENHNSVVSKHDRIFILGDFAFKHKGTIESIVKKLNGYKILVMGNHDTYSLRFYQESGFNEVYKYPIILEDYFVLSHKPVFVYENSHFANIFGHAHDEINYKDYTEKSFCCSVERINYTPIEWNEVLRKMESCLDRTS